MHQPDASSQKGAWVLGTVINMHHGCTTIAVNMTRTTDAAVDEEILESKLMPLTNTSQPALFQAGISNCISMFEQFDHDIVKSSSASRLHCLAFPAISCSTASALPDKLNIIIGSPSLSQFYYVMKYQISHEPKVEVPFKLTWTTSTI